MLEASQSLSSHANHHKISTAVYRQLGYRAVTMLRGALIALIYEKMMALPAGKTSESCAMSLMGSDVEAFADYFHDTICDTWADILQLGLAIFLLAKLIGLVCIAPIIIVVRKYASQLDPFGGQCLTE